MTLFPILRALFRKKPITTVYVRFCDYCAAKASVSCEMHHVFLCENCLSQHTETNDGQCVMVSLAFYQLTVEERARKIG